MAPEIMPPNTSVSCSDWRIRAIMAQAEVRNGNIRLTLKELSQHFATSEHYLGILFACRTGTKFRQYLRAIRMRKAAELLDSSDHAIQEVARLLGYSDLSNFGSEFRAAWGMSPRSYRQASRWRRARLPICP